MVWLAVLIVAVLTQADPRVAARGALPALLALLPTMLSPGVSTSHFLPPLHREWLKASAALLTASLAPRFQPGLAGALAAGAGFVLPMLAGYW